MSDDYYKLSEYMDLCLQNCFTDIESVLCRRKNRSSGSEQASPNVISLRDKGVRSVHLSCN